MKSPGMKTMTESQGLTQLRADLRADVAAQSKRHDALLTLFYDRMEEFTKDNTRAHACLQKQLSALDKKTEVKTSVIATKIALFVIGVSIIATGLASTVWNRIIQ